MKIESWLLILFIAIIAAGIGLGYLYFRGSKAARKLVADQVKSKVQSTFDGVKKKGG